MKLKIGQKITCKCFRIKKQPDNTPFPQFRKSFNFIHPLDSNWGPKPQLSLTQKDKQKVSRKIIRNLYTTSLTTRKKKGQNRTNIQPFYFSNPYL